MPSAGQDPVLDFLICWYVAAAGEGRHQVMAAIRRRAERGEALDAEGGPRLWSWCVHVWLPGWLRAAGMIDQARQVERSGSAALSDVRHAAREAAMRRASRTPPVCTVLERLRASAAVDASGAAAVACAGVPGDQASLALAAVRDAAYVALRDGTDIGRVVARSRRAALDLVDGIASGGGRRRGGAAPPMTADQGGWTCRT